MGHPRRLQLVLLWIFLGSLLLTTQGMTAESSDDSPVNKAAIRIMDFSFPDGSTSSLPAADAPPVSLDFSQPSPASFGHKLGETYWDMQHIGSTGRQIAWGSDPECPWILHTGWTFLPAAVLADRNIAYSSWNGSTGTGSSGIDLIPLDEYGGFVNVGVTSNNRAIITGNLLTPVDEHYRSSVWWEFACDTWFFPYRELVPDGLAAIGNCYPPGSIEADVVWPRVAWQEPAGDDPVLHVLACDYGTRQGMGTLHYFQRIGEATAGTWTVGWPVDTIFNPEGYDLCASDDGIVAITWVANPPLEGDDDTCSYNGPTSSRERDLWENDLYCQINRNYGRGIPGTPYDGSTNFWEYRMNLTCNPFGTNGFRPFADMSTMIDQYGSYHVAFVAMEWDDYDVGTYRSRIFHWSEDLGFDFDLKANLRTVASAQWDPENCNPGPFKENQAKVSIAECDDKFYVMWAEYNSPHTTGNINHDDCAARAFQEGYGYIGAANADLLVSISADGGFTWDPARNLTDSYGGPTGNPNGACDVAGPAGPCPSEDWPGMTAYGSDYPVDLPIDPNIADIDPSYTGDHYLDVMYIDDPDPGAAVMGYGTWQSSDVRWIRIPCTEPIASPIFAMTPDSSDSPEYVKHGVEEYIEVTLENLGNVELSYVVDVEEDPGPYSGWLYVSVDSGHISSGMGNSEILEVTINKSGVVDNPGEDVHLTGRVNFAHNGPGGVDVFEVDVVVSDTFPAIDAGNWTVLIYMNGDNSLQANAIEDLNEMEQVFLSNDVAGPRGVDIPNEVNVVVQIDIYDIGYPDNASDNTTRRYYVKYDGDDPAIGSMRLDTLPALGEKDMGDWETLAEFADWGITNFPADKYALILWDHGDGWYRDGEDDHDSPLKGVCWDDTDGSHIGVANEDLRKALQQTYEKLRSRKIDLLGFDACLMQMWEVMEVANSYARYMVGSEETENLDGWAYNGLLADLVEAKQPLTAEEFGAAICHASVCDSVVGPCDDQSTASCVDLSKIEILTLDMQFLSSDLVANPADAARARALRIAMRSVNPDHEYDIDDGILWDNDWHIDLYEFADRLSLDPLIDPVTKAHAEAVRDAIDQAVTYNLFSAEYNWSHGIAVYYPLLVYDTDYNLLPSSDWTKWDEFLKGNTGCCVNPGDGNHDGSVDISDLTYFVDYMFAGGPGPVCMEEFDNDGNCTLDISDLTYYVDFLFGGGPPPVPCHTCP